MISTISPTNLLNSYHIPIYTQDFGMGYALEKSYRVVFIGVSIGKDPG